jgi:methylmalonyl-CoA mutase
MQQKLLAEFPDVTYETWRAQVEQDLKSKGSDFDKRLLTRTPEGIVVQPLYTARDVADLPPQRASASDGQLDLRAEIASPDLAVARTDLTAELAAGATSLWLRFDLRAQR